MKLNNLVYIKRIIKFRKNYYKDENIFSFKFFKDYLKLREYIKEIVNFKKRSSFKKTNFIK